MSKELAHPDRVILQDALKRTPQLATVAGRMALVRGILGGPAIDNALDWLDWEGNSFVFASGLVTALEHQEQSPGVPALAVLAQTIEPMANAEHRARLADLRRRLGWGPVDPASSTAAPSTWHEQRTAAQIVQERIIGEDTLKPMYYLRRALAAADAVVRVNQNGAAKGTGFLIAPTLMMTNHHVIDGEASAQSAQAVFFDEVADTRETAAGIGHRQSVTVGVAAKSSPALVYTDAALDVSIIRLAAASDLLSPPIRPLPLRRRASLDPRGRVVIIQHPGGYPKQISLQNNLIAHADHRIVQYYTSTKAGSSGSPVFDNEFSVVAIHHGWVHNPAWDKGADAQLLRYDAADPKQVEDLQYRNEGTTMAALLEALARDAPQLLQELTILEG